MNELATARDQLEHAIARLEAALAARTDKDAGDPAVEQALSDAREDYARLLKVTDAVSHRLDAAIHRLRTALDQAGEDD